MRDRSLEERIGRYYRGESSIEEERSLREALLGLAADEVEPPAGPIVWLAELGRELISAEADAPATESAFAELLGARPVSSRRPPSPVRVALLAASIAAVAFSAGLWLGQQPRGNARQDDVRLAALEANVIALRRSMVLSLLDSTSETEQLRGAALARELPQLEAGEIVRLTQAVRSARGVGVRLAALETLYFFSSNPEARACLERAIDTGQPPLVQSSWVDLMVAAGRSGDLLREVAERPSVDASVRRKILTLIDA
jgi:hypothetical protein